MREIGSVATCMPLCFGERGVWECGVGNVGSWLVDGIRRFAVERERWFG